MMIGEAYQRTAGQFWPSQYVHRWHMSWTHADCGYAEGIPRWSSYTLQTSPNCESASPKKHAAPQRQRTVPRCLFSCHLKHAARGRLGHEALLGSQLCARLGAGSCKCSAHWLDISMRRICNNCCSGLIFLFLLHRFKFGLSVSIKFR